jgi:hypothetical protein
LAAFGARVEAKAGKLRTKILSERHVSDMGAMRLENLDSKAAPAL